MAAANMHVTAGGWSLEAMKTGARTAHAVLTDPSGEVSNLDLTNVQYRDGLLGATVAVNFLRPSFVARLDSNVFVATVNHSWFADGDHKFELQQADVPRVRAFLEGFKT